MFHERTNEWMDGWMDLMEAEEIDAIEQQQFGCIKHLINCTILDPSPHHARTAAEVYSRKARYEDISHCQRRDQVLLAQLRIGHCRELTAVHNIIDPYCPSVAARRAHLNIASRISSYSKPSSDYI